MDPLSLYPILPVILVALATTKIMARILKIAPAEGHYAAIDGLRGYLAFFVFLHHSSIWFFYLRGYGWGAPPSMLYTHFGPTSVALFFMITSFLFFNKLLSARERKIDWLKLYVSRVLRIYPLYIFMLIALFTCVAVLSHFILHTSFADLLLGALQWSVFIQANLNGMLSTSRIISSVVWSLPFEWMFYCALPLLGLLVKIRTSFLVLLAALGGTLFFFYIIETFYPMGGMKLTLPFISGMLAAILARNKRLRELASSTGVSIAIIILLALILGLYTSILDPVPLLIMTFVFCAIACGNDVFGILTHSLSRTFGQISYGIYLLHGMVLFATFRWILGFQRAGHLSPLEYWGIIMLCGAAVAMVCSLTYRLIERPAMDIAPEVTGKLRAINSDGAIIPD